ncbi:hypothetical protein Snoj_26290 [Streptomyces nojiriensis]|uniref:Uncharacterized protein n=1 Tax=Streptomyces nojiriensis TaxID=66374 RepID=A0ABQ3SKP4_9ACTN|nr:hypothetical protein [Streptomyces nojiriensis]GGS29760.1 hypothetical protein GCM10010205_69890 [Streptomyces nojiriensis]GHI68711.1 hypothetical protein Snoj_26290 [Streptomyces nojiriensis]
MNFEVTYTHGSEGSWLSCHHGILAETRFAHLQGVNFDTDREVWRTEYVRREIAAVQEQLHGNAVLLLGHQLDQDAEQTLAFLGSVARVAESLRTRYPRVGPSVGTELTIFMFGPVPGRDYEERGQALGRPESAGYQERLNAFPRTSPSSCSCSTPSRPSRGGPTGSAASFSPSARAVGTAATSTTTRFGPVHRRGT